MDRRSFMKGVVSASALLAMPFSPLASARIGMIEGSAPPAVLYGEYVTYLQDSTAAHLACWEQINRTLQDLHRPDLATAVEWFHLAPGEYEGDPLRQAGVLAWKVAVPV